MKTNPAIPLMVVVVGTLVATWDTPAFPWAVGISCIVVLLCFLFIAHDIVATGPRQCWECGKVFVGEDAHEQRMACIDDHYFEAAAAAHEDREGKK